MFEDDRDTLPAQPKQVEFKKELPPWAHAPNLDEIRQWALRLFWRLGLTQRRMRGKD